MSVRQPHLHLCLPLSASDTLRMIAVMRRRSSVTTKALFFKHKRPLPCPPASEPQPLGVRDEDIWNLEQGLSSRSTDGSSRHRAVHACWRRNGVCHTLIRRRRNSIRRGHLCRWNSHVSGDCKSKLSTRRKSDRYGSWEPNWGSHGNDVLRFSVLNRQR